MKTPRQLISEIQMVKDILTHEAAEAILYTLTDNQETFKEVFDEDWFRTSAFKIDDLIRDNIAQENPKKFNTSFESILKNLLSHLNENYLPMTKEKALLECDKLQTIINHHYEIEGKKVEVISVKVSENGADDFDPLVKCKIYYPVNGGTFFTTYLTEYFKTNAKAIEPE